MDILVWVEVFALCGDPRDVRTSLVGEGRT